MSQKSRNKKFLFFALLLILLILLFAAIIYKLRKKDVVRPLHDRPRVDMLQDTLETKDEAIKTLKAKTTLEIQKLLNSISFSVDTFLDEGHEKMGLPFWGNNEISRGIPLEAYVEWLNQLSNVNLANARELAKSLSLGPLPHILASIRKKIDHCRFNLRHLSLVEVFSREDSGRTLGVLDSTVNSISCISKITPELIHSIEEGCKGDLEELKSAKRRLIRAFDSSISFMSLFVSFDLDFFTEEVLENYLELRDYVINNF